MCLHESTIKTQESEIVWLECGEVIDIEYVQKINFEDHFMADELGDLKIVNFLRDVISNANINSECMFNTMFTFKELRKEERFQSLNNCQILCYSLYNSCIINDCSKTPEEVSYYFGISPKTIWNIEKILNQSVALCPSLIMSRVISLLNVPYFH